MVYLFDSRAVDPHGMMGPRRRSMSRTSHRGGGADGLASVHENDETNSDDSDDESDAIGKRVSLITRQCV